MDVLSASALTDDKIAWYENTDGAGSFGPPAGDLHGGGTEPNRSSRRTWTGTGIWMSSPRPSLDDKIAWYENTDGAGSFGTQQVISTEAATAFSVFAADVDGTGIVDVLSASYLTDDKIAWYENTDGAGSFGSQQVISTAAGRFMPSRSSRRTWTGMGTWTSSPPRRLRRQDRLV